MIQVGKYNISKDLIKYFVAISLMFSGMFLCIYGTIYAEPIGVLDGSLITLFGLLLSFGSATFSIHDYYQYQTAKFQHSIREEYRNIETSKVSSSE